MYSAACSYLMTEEATVSAAFCRELSDEWLEIWTTEVSSTYLYVGKFRSRSFIMQRKRLGPNLVPWGTPLFSLTQSNRIELPSWTRWHLLLRKDVGGRTPRSLSFLNRIEWSIRSNAYMGKICFLVLSMSWISAKVIEHFFKQSNWFGSIMPSTTSHVHYTG